MLRLANSRALFSRDTHRACRTWSFLAFVLQRTVKKLCCVYKDLQCTYKAIFVFIHIKPFVWGCSCHLCRHGSLKLPDDDVTIAGWSDVSHLVSCHHLFNSQLSYSLLPMSSHQLVSSRMSVCKYLLVLLSLITKLSINKVLTVICCNIFVLIVDI